MENSLQPHTGVAPVLKKAFFYWKSTIIYQLLFSVLYFGLFFIGYFYLLQYFGLWDEFMKHRDLVSTDLPSFNKKMEEIARLPQARNFGLAFFFLTALINPLNVGLYKVYRKIDQKEEVFFNDLFAGYQGITFFRFVGFYLFWIIIFTYANAIFLLGIVWYLLTLFCVPLMFFMDVKIFEGISLTFKVLRKNLSVILITAVVALLFGFSGVLLCGVGILLTFPFIHSMIYTLYQQFYNEVE